MNYNAKGQREEIFFGNNSKTKYEYDPETYRLTRLLTTANNGNSIIQDLNYTYDPAGNITRQFDNAQKTIFYGGQQVEAQSNYIYDALYRLIEATGREHTGQAGVNAQDNFNDDWCRLDLQPNSPVQLRNYMQKYFYDAVGNMVRTQHIAGALGNWTRLYTYNPANNQLTKTSVGGQNYNYTYNEHGSMLTMPHLQLIDWNFKEGVQHVNLGGGGEAWYVYDSNGQRLRKVIERGGNKIEERIYAGAFEVYRERTGNSITLERETLHVMDDKQRVAMIESRTKGNDGSPQQIIRYQYTNHLGSTSLELDAVAKIIAYEEYHPFGTTAYQATDASRQVPKKRYRYTGMERDEETGLNYHSTRYYAQWLARWISCDIAGLVDGVNLYAYVRNNPLQYLDKNGKQGRPADSDTSVPPSGQPAPPAGPAGSQPAPAGTSSPPPTTGGGTTPASNPTQISDEGKSDLNAAKGALAANAAMTFTSAILVGAAIGALFGGIGAVVGAAIGAVVGFLQTLILAAGTDPDNRKSETYKDLLTVASWFNPWALIATAIGLGLFALNLFFFLFTFGDVEEARITDVGFYHGAFVYGGGLIRPGRAWTSGNIIQYNPDNFKAIGPTAAEFVLRHEWGHVLNNAHFGLFQIESPLNELFGGQQTGSLFERLAESNVNPNVNLPAGLNKDQRRTSGGRGFGEVPWWNP
jgi:RHS repeat-associated protein